MWKKVKITAPYWTTISHLIWEAIFVVVFLCTVLVSPFDVVFLSQQEVLLFSSARRCSPILLEIWLHAVARDMTSCCCYIPFLCCWEMDWSTGFAKETAPCCWKKISALLKMAPCCWKLYGFPLLLNIRLNICMLFKRIEQTALLQVWLYAVVKDIRTVDFDFFKDTAPCNCNLLLHKTMLIAFGLDFITVHLLLLKIRLLAVTMVITIPAVGEDTGPCCWHGYFILLLLKLRLLAVNMVHYTEKRKSNFPHVRKFGVEQLLSHIWGRAS